MDSRDSEKNRRSQQVGQASPLSYGTAGTEVSDPAEGKFHNESKARLPRYQRANKPPPMRLQPRDMAVLRAIGCEYRYLTARQIHLLFFGGSMSQTRLRLTKLYHNSYLDRVYRPTVKGSAEAIYCLDRKGADVLAAELDIDRGQIFWQGRRKMLSQRSLEHALRVNDFRIAVAVACKRTGAAKLAGHWIDEQILRDLNQKVRIPHPSDPDSHTECPIVPDGLFGLEFENGLCQFFMLEMDLGTESNRRFGLRVRAYKEYLASEKYQEFFEGKSFKILVVTTSAQRVENLLKTARKAGDKSVFWFTDFSQYRQDGKFLPEQLMARIWRVPGDWFAVNEEWRGGRYAPLVKPKDTGRHRSLLELAGTARG